MGDYIFSQLALGDPGFEARLRDMFVLGWAMSNQYQVTSATVDDNNVIQTARVTWPNGQQGTYTVTQQNTSFPVADAFTITYEYGNGGIRTVTQPVGVTRNTQGAILNSPDLTIM
ncbi:hypothetical protein CBA19C8_16995 [Paraburkholderia terrae]|nr:hypothetical protein CBA19C8_16995 [Paraburkholderia terrae]